VNASIFSFLTDVFDYYFKAFDEAEIQRLIQQRIQQMGITAIDRPNGKTSIVY
jgi:hypothetical protein